MGKRNEADLERIAGMTEAIREHSDQIKRLSEKRRAVCLRLRDNHVTYGDMARAMGVTEVAVFKILKGDDNKVPPRRN